jgi:phosphatidylinositol alpha-mannosyltransferase
MKVALVCPYSWTTPGGVQAHIRGLARELRLRGHEVELLAPSDRKIAAGSFRRVGRTVSIPDNESLVPVSLSPLAPIRTWRHLAERGYDLVHVHEPMIPAVSLAATLTSAAPLVGTFHMYASRPRWYRPFAPLCRSALARLDVRIAVSEAARWHVARTCSGDYRIVPNGVDWQHFASLRAERTGSRILFVGRGEPRKGLPVLLEAFERVPEGAELDLVGVGPSALPHRLRARGRIHAHGRVSDDVRDELLARADVLCAPSLAGESFGIVLVEAMAAGIPVVASALPGYVGVLPEKVGRLVPPGDSAALAAALTELIADGELRARLGAAGREAARRYDWSQVADEVLAAYDDALAHRGRTRQRLGLRAWRSRPRPLVRGPGRVRY